MINQIKFRNILNGNKAFSKNDVELSLIGVLETWNYKVDKTKGDVFVFSIIGIPRLTNYKKNKKYNHYFKRGSFSVWEKDGRVEIIWQFSNSYIYMYCLSVFFGLILLGITYSLVFEALIAGVLFSIAMFIVIVNNIREWSKNVIKIVGQLLRE